MIDAKEFSKLRKELEGYRKVKDRILDLSREVITLSKRVIYSQQRGEETAAQELLKEMQEHYQELFAVLKKRPDMLGNGMVSVAGQELVEASAYVALEQGKAVPRAADLHVDALTYLLGIADLSGELVRSAVLSSIRGDAGRVSELRGILQGLYGELIKIDNREKDLRRKIDKVGYDLEKVENLMLDLSLKGEPQKS